MCEMGFGSSAAAAEMGWAGRDEPAQLTDRQLLERVTSRQARCVAAGVDPDAWFPVATRWQQARAEAAAALALCAACPVRAECLELSMRQWAEAGRHGVWGGLLEAERAAVREQWLAGTSIIRLLAGGMRTGRAPVDENETHKI
jgi:WhiB family redox-sensing transcriptional regulator